MITTESSTGRPDLSRLRIRREEPYAARSGGDRRRRVLLISAGVVLPLAVVIAVFGRGRAVEVETATVERLSPAGSQSLLTATGYVVAQRKADVASKGTGRLEVLNVEEGDRVQAGDVIGQIEANDVRASLAAARAGVAQADAERLRAQAIVKEARLAFDRVRELREHALAAQSEFDAAEARYETAEAAVRSAEASLSSARANERWAEVQVENTFIRAPFDGTVLTKYADVGEVVAPFAASASSRGAVVTLADMASLKVEADVSESNIRQIAVSQPCLITLDAMPSDPYRGRVEKIVPTADRARATVLVKVVFDALDDRVLPEMSAKVSFLPASADSQDLQTGTVLSVPRAAIAERGGRTVVFVAKQDRAREVAVTTGRAYGGAVEIRDGLAGDEIVVVDPSAKLRDGSRIRLKT